MRNYKPVLRVSVRPERIVLYFIVVVTLLACFVAWRSDYPIYALLSFVVLAYLALRKYYFLHTSQAVVGFEVDEEQSLLMVETRQGARRAKVVDALQLRHYLMLYIMYDKSGEKSHRIQNFWQLFYDELCLFVGARRVLICVSEYGLGPEKFRQLLRWVNRKR